MKRLLVALAAVLALTSVAHAVKPTRTPYSPWLSPQLFGMLPDWPGDVADYKKGEADAKEFERKSQASYARYNADHAVAMAMAQKMTDADDDTVTGVKAWLAWVDRHDANTDDDDRLDVLRQQDNDLELEYLHKHEALQHNAQIEALNGGGCDHAFALEHKYVQSHYQLAVEENGLLKGLFSRMRAVVQDEVRREERVAHLYAALAPPHQIRSYDTISSLQSEALNSTGSLAGWMFTHLQSQIEPWVTSRDEMLADHRGCH